MENVFILSQPMKDERTSDILLDILRSRLISPNDVVFWNPPGSLDLTRFLTYYDEQRNIATIRDKFMNFTEVFLRGTQRNFDYVGPNMLPKYLVLNAVGLQTEASNTENSASVLIQFMAWCEMRGINIIVIMLSGKLVTNKLLEDVTVPETLNTAIKDLGPYGDIPQLFDTIEILINTKDKNDVVIGGTLKGGSGTDAKSNNNN